MYHKLIIVLFLFIIFRTKTKGEITLLLEAQAKWTYTLTSLISTSCGIVLSLISAFSMNLHFQFGQFSYYD